MKKHSGRLTWIETLQVSILKNIAVQMLYQEGSAFSIFIRCQENTRFTQVRNTECKHAVYLQENST